MAKIKAVKSVSNPTVDKVALLSPLARELDVPISTLHAAIAAGHVESVALGCGSKAVVIASAKAWAASPRKRGPKPAGD